MKTKLFTMLLIFASIAYDASAYKIIIRGGTSDHKFYEVIVTNNLTSCKGRGTNKCPVAGINEIQATISGIPMSKIVRYILEQVEEGTLQGRVNFEGSLPCSWRKADAENVEIDIKSEDVKGLYPVE